MDNQVYADGVEDCPKCDYAVLVWSDGKERRFEMHYKEYPRFCTGYPKDKKNDPQ